MRLGFSESILTQGGPSWVFALQPIPILINQIISNAYRRPQGIDDDYFASIDIDWIPRLGLRLIGELLMDDLVLPIPQPNQFPSRWGATLGFQSVQAGGRSLAAAVHDRPQLDLLCDQSGLALPAARDPSGDPLGADFDALHVSWRPSPDRPLGVWMTYIRKGEGQVGRIWADLTEATTYPFLRGVVEYSTMLGLDVAVQGGQGWAGR
jgi:hypothetical protein